MSESAQRTPPPDPPEDDAELDNETSSIRPRVEPDPTLPCMPNPPLKRRARHPSGVREAPEGRPGRVEEMIRLAKILLADLPANHQKAGLLRIAVVRRDEVLLARILADLAGSGSGKHSSVVPPRVALTPPTPTTGREDD